MKDKEILHYEGLAEDDLSCSIDDLTKPIGKVEEKWKWQIINKITIIIFFIKLILE